ncbi:MAG: VWA domain-containing protein [Acidobacteria bacterium]|nr:VWA domain-containing protein [Acidobacteriota bacterium]
MAQLRKPLQLGNFYSKFKPASGRRHRTRQQNLARQWLVAGRRSGRSNASRPSVASALLLVAVLATARATLLAGVDGESSTVATLSSKVRVVNLLATVRDKHKKIVPDLKVSDFTLEEDNHPVPIQYFSRETDLPLKVGLLVDTSLSQRNTLEEERTSSKSFLAQVLRQNDSAFVIHFDREVELVQDLTASREKLESALDSLHTPSPYEQDRSGPGSGGSGPRRDEPGGQQRRHRMHRAGTTLYDAIFLASDELMKKQPGRKALIVLTDGVDRGSKETLEQAIEAAQRADTVVYGIFFKGEESSGNPGGFRFPGGMGGPMGGPMGGHRRGGRGAPYPEQTTVDGKKILERIARETGGRMFEVSKKEPIAQIYSSIEEDLRNQYNLGFTPGKGDSPGYHKLVLKTNQKDDTVHTREGFYLETD